VALIIDGYNLLHVTGLFGRGKASLEASRQALLGFLAAAVEPAELAATIVIFDAAAAPPGLPDRYVIHGIDVRFARGYESADALLEELIAAHPTPRKLTVVSSDHRVQRRQKTPRSGDG
jgi:predicted RNA-binding protein with PIN domain